jgi:hypothetical protein
MPHDHERDYSRAVHLVSLFKMITITKHAQDVMQAAEAEQPRDDALLAYAASKLAHAQSTGFIECRYSELEETIRRAEEALQRCKAWLPELHRKILNRNISLGPKAVLDAVREKYPRDFDRITIDRALYTGIREGIVSRAGPDASIEKEFPPKTCDCCGAQGYDMLRCAACKEARYCNKRCQKAAWKNGHKHECNGNRQQQHR